MPESEFKISVKPYSSIFTSELNPDNTSLADLIAFYPQYDQTVVRNHRNYWQFNDSRAEVVQTRISETFRADPDFRQQLSAVLPSGARGIELTPVNFGIFNHICKVEAFDFEQTFFMDPVAYAVISRPDRPDSLTTNAEMTLLDYHSLKEVASGVDYMLSLGVCQPDLVLLPPVVRPLGIAATENTAIMINTKAGWTGKDKPAHACAEVNLQVFYIDGYPRPAAIFEVNGSSAEKGMNGSPFRKELKIRNNFLNEADWDHVSRGITHSGRLASGYVAALTQTWFLTGKRPRMFEVNAGDGVLLDLQRNPYVADIQLITMRGGLIPSPVSMREFGTWLMNLESPSLNPSYDVTAKGLKHYGRERDVKANIFHGMVIDAGINEAIRRTFLPEHVPHIEQFLVKNPEATYAKFQEFVRSLKKG